jgi:hypothetical protein
MHCKNNIKVDQRLIEQYLQNKKIAKSFAIYYDLFNKYKSDYQADTILAGTVSVDIKDRAKAAKFDERLSLLGLMLDKITEEARSVIYTELTMIELLTELKTIRSMLNATKKDAVELLKKQISQKTEALAKGIKASSLSQDTQYAYRGTIAALEETAKELDKLGYKDSEEAFKKIKGIYDKKITAFKNQAADASDKMSNVFKFCEDVFSYDGQEILILVTELTINYYCAKFISRYGCPEYFKHNKELLFYERQKDIIRELEILDLHE